MAKHLENGKLGEKLAADFLKKQGYAILHVNWRYKYYEVDIVAKDGTTLVFVEVKSRSSSAFGTPDSFVNHKKQAFLLRAAEEYLQVSNYDGEIRFDIISVYLNENNHIELIKDAFWSN